MRRDWRGMPSAETPEHLSELGNLLLLEARQLQRLLKAPSKL